jgi:formate hydrogenlyase subunit 6/NADH:ubiquinone oxidoreductase subunit I
LFYSGDPITSYSINYVFLVLDTRSVIMMKSVVFVRFKSNKSCVKCITCLLCTRPCASNAVWGIEFQLPVELLFPT